MSKLVCIGIDNGLRGALVAVDSDFNLIDWADTPTIITNKPGRTAKGNKKKKTLFATTEMGNTLRGMVHNFQEYSVMVWIEKAQAMPGQGVSSTFTTGRGFGLWEGIAIGLGLKYDIVAPRTWTKAVLTDVPRGDPKQRSFVKSQRLFPTLPLTTPNGRVLTMDGRSDAALIAYYGVVQLLGRKPRNVKPVRKK